MTGMIAEAWTANNWMAAQTIVMAITAAIVTWYTIETHLMRRQMKKQTGLLEKQIADNKDAFDKQIEAERNKHRPFIVFTKTKAGSFSRKYIFVNNGATITNPVIDFDPRFEFEIEPPTAISHGEEGVIEIRMKDTPFPDSIRFQLTYKTILGDTESKSFEAGGYSGMIPKETAPPHSP